LIFILTPRNLIYVIENNRLFSTCLHAGRI
jgi:hypothetical protein